MTWEPAKRRWRKLYKGKLYTVSCRQLNSSETKAESYQAANLWWERKRAEIDGGPPPRPHADILSHLELRRDVSRALGALPEADALDQKIAFVRAMEDEPREDVEQALYDFDVFDEVFPDHSDTDDRIAIARQNGIVIPDDADPSVLDYLFGDRRLRLDREVRKPVLPRNQVPANRTVAAQIDRYLALQRQRTDAGQISASEFALIQRCVKAFEKWVGDGDNIDKINAQTWEDWFLHLLGEPKSIEYKKKLFRYAKNYIMWLVEKGMIAAFPNLNSRRYRFGSSDSKVETFTPEEVKRLMDEADGQVKLYLLLCANCGMTQQDISDLMHEEVDLERGRIRRKRSKTGHWDHVPVVEYPLWPETLNLLEKHRRTESERVLLTETGRPLVREWIGDDGKLKKVDTVRLCYVRLQKRANVSKPLKLFRKTSPSLLETNKSYGKYVQHFLGHAPRDLASAKYVRPDQKQFDEAVLWLGQQYGFL